MQKNIVNNFNSEVISGNRFEFGKNWKSFLQNLQEDQIVVAEESLKEFLELSNLKGKTFIDVGSGSGIMSLAAVRLGAKVFSFDYDPSCVWCTEQLRKKYQLAKTQWQIEEGSILDEKYISDCAAKGKFDIVYSWGVLHHTGNMKKSFEIISRLVKPKGGILFIAIYNDQGFISKIWQIIKKLYCKSPKVVKSLIVLLMTIVIWGIKFATDIIKLKPFNSWKNYYKIKRGMSPWHNVIDWVGGYPFEVAKPNEVVNYFSSLGFSLQKIKTVGFGHGNNQFVFKKN